MKNVSKMNLEELLENYSENELAALIAANKIELSEQAFIELFA